CARFPPYYGSSWYFDVW
nr:immunoglobulin heavy chain junction region [Mus musculus]NSM05116.1 immunoglobulin heavy chain junction region [Mus musculus]NSM06828.1 immunoglobulin heavy chain junction region [Mus musculus]